MDMEDKKLKRISLCNILTAYILAFGFLLLIFISREPEKAREVELSFTDLNKTIQERDIEYVENNSTIIVNNHDAIYADRLRGIVFDRGLEEGVVDNRAIDDRILLRRTDTDFGYVLDNEASLHTSNITRNGLHSNNGVAVRRGRDGLHFSDEGDIRGAKRIKDVVRFEDAISRLDRKREDVPAGLTKNIDSDGGLDISNLSLDDKSNELGDIDFTKGPLGTGPKGGELYAYNFPSQGVGAGVGSSSVGAGAAAGAGLSAGVGEAVLNGETVPTLGGIGTSSLPFSPSDPSTPPTDGVGGLMGGAGAGGAAGLMHGYITEKLGMGAGCAEHGANCEGHGGHRAYNFDHLPADGALHIMMHVDGSGSILNTRKQLDIMKDTLLKEALLPYYNNNESLYNNRVSIIANSGERTLKFFSKATERENVLAVAFQDEAQPSYHLPNFNKKPEGDYLDDLKVLKSKLNSHDGIYRGIMFQVDRGKTFAKSFKEFVSNSFQGKGYLKNRNLKEYYWQSNPSDIRQKKGIVFSDEYHAKDDGTPQYYLDLLFKASKKVGLDLNTYGAGLTDGKKVQK
jgi:hypothetical protein